VNLEKYLQYATHHSEAIIQWLFLAILTLTGLLIARNLFAKKEEVHAGGAALAGGEEIRSFLQKIMEQTAKLEAIPKAGMTEATAASIDAQVQALKKDLSSRDEEIKALKSAAPASAGTASADAEALNGRLKELESKLAEYEILEDDIADLSLFKDENARLKAELDKMRTGGGTSAPAPAAAPVVTAAEAMPGPELNVQEQLKLTETGDPMQDFESAVKLEKKLTGGGEATIEQAGPSTSATTTEPAKEADDLFAEFAVAQPEAEAAEAAPAPVESASEPPDQGALDTNKMMEEMAALTSMSASAEGTGLHDDGIDTDKMAAEATNLTKS
jgi:hypothetical protein